MLSLNHTYYTHHSLIQ